MKSKFWIALFFLLAGNVAMAQFHIGVKAGANITKIDGRSFQDEFKYGYHLGGFAEVGLGNNFGLQPEVLFNQYETKVSNEFETIYQNADNDIRNKDVKLNYLSVPVLLTYKFIGNFLTLQAGPQFGVLMNQDKTLLQNGAEAFKKGDFSMVGGAQIKVSKLRLTGRYVVGLNNINDIDNRDQWKNQGFQLSVGLAL